MYKERLTQLGNREFPIRIVPTDWQVNVPLHSHDFTEIVIFQRGSAIHNLYHGHEKMTYCLMQGDCFSILPKEKHSYINGDGAYFSNLIFSDDVIAHEIDELKKLSSYDTFFGKRSKGTLPHIRLNTAERKEVDRLLNLLDQVIIRHRPGTRLEAKNILLQILLILLRKEPISSVNAANHFTISKKLLEVIKNIENHPEKTYSMQELSYAAGMCISGFTKKFHALTGLAPSEYILSLRLQKATDLLYTTEYSLEEIARECGFYDANYLIKAFKRRYGVTPGKFRSNQKQ